MWWYEPRNLLAGAKYKRELKKLIEDVGTQLIAQAKDLPPTDYLRIMMENLGAAIIRLAEPSTKILIKIFHFGSKNRLGRGQQIGTELQMKELEAEIRDEFVIMFNGVKQVSELLHLALQAAADKVEEFIDENIKDLQPEDVMKLVYEPQLQIISVGDGHNEVWMNAPESNMASEFQDFLDTMKSIVEDYAKTIMRKDDEMPAAWNKACEELGTAIFPLGESLSNLMLKPYQLYTRHCLDDGNRLLTETEFHALEAEMFEEVKDEAVVVTNGVKEIARLVHEIIQNFANKVEIFSDKVKDMTHEEALKMLFDPPIQVTPEEEENTLDENAWLLIDM